MHLHLWLMIFFYMGFETGDVIPLAIPDARQCVYMSRELDAELGQFGLYVGCESFHSMDTKE
jgi:hypothetical protein